MTMVNPRDARKSGTMTVASPLHNLPDPLALLDRAMAEADWDSVAIGGPRSMPAEPGDPPARRLPFPRCAIMLDGRKDHVISQCGIRRPIRARCGQVLHFASSAWDIDLWSTPCRYLGLVFRPHYLRVIEVAFAGGTAPCRETTSAHHTQLPFGGEGRQVLAALDTMASTNGSEAAPLLVHALFLLARKHLATDLDGPPIEGAKRTWQEAMELIDERLSEPLSRDTVARALGLHPNYLSALFTQHAGASFQKTIERLRIERACGILSSDREVSIRDAAQQCGYSDTGYFTRVFRRLLGKTPSQYARMAH